MSSFSLVNFYQQQSILPYQLSYHNHNKTDWIIREERDTQEILLVAT